MCEFIPFRNRARQEFPDLIVSVHMFEQGSGGGGEVIQYQVDVAGQPIGTAPLSATATSVDDVIKALIKLVAPARRAVRQARDAGQRARSARPSYRSVA
jgi:hypothetical protein